MKRILLAVCVAGGLTLSACAPGAVVRVGRELGATLYLPQGMPQGMTLAGVRRLGPHMAALSYKGDGRIVSIFESPEPIAPPPGATRDRQGVWRGVAVVDGTLTMSRLIHLPGAFIEVMAVGIGEKSLDRLDKDWRPISP